MKFGVLCFVFAAVGNARAILSPAGENVCMVYEKYVDYIQVRKLVPVTIQKVEWCWKIPPRCTVESQTYQTILDTKKIPRVRIVPKCCNGYKEVVAESKCVPVCSEPCLNGDCIEPEECSCESGFYGGRCEKPCPPGAWGRGCLEKCECDNGATCDGVHGDCTCTPGWRGIRCDLPCEPGYYGTNCESRCDCGGGLCDPVSGECEAGNEVTATIYVLEETATHETTADATDSDNLTGGSTGASASESTTELVEPTEPTDPSGTGAPSEGTDPSGTGAPSEGTDPSGTGAPSEGTDPSENTTEASTSAVGYSTSSIPDVPEKEEAEEEEEEEEEVEVEEEGGLNPNNANKTSGYDEAEDYNVKDNEIEHSQDFVQKRKFNLVSLLENFSIICGVFVLIFVVTMGSVMVSHYRKIRKMGLEFRQNNKNSNSQSFAIYRFYGGAVLPAKTILDNICTTNLDVQIEQPKMMTFKPLPEEKEKEFFNVTDISKADNFDNSSEPMTNSTVFRGGYDIHFEYDEPKSVNIIHTRLKFV